MTRSLCKKALDKKCFMLYFGIMKEIKIIQSKFNPVDGRIKIPVDMMRQLVVAELPKVRVFENEKRIFIDIPKPKKHEKQSSI